ncbi:MAG: sulfotransferase [Planctomycetaceae bacterium]
MSEVERDINPYPFWAPRYWGGMTVSGWWKLLRGNHFAVHPSKLQWAMVMAVVSPANSFAGMLQNLLFSRRVKQTELIAPPIFVIGHWRSGTTYLQELLSLDERHAAPTTLQSYGANHFLLTESFITRFLGWLLPPRRPMDNVEISWDSPQEDEWALSTMGLPTPYQKIAFPSNAPPALNYLDMEGLTDEELERWSGALRYFFQAVTLRTGRRLVLKSPHHTGRVHVLSRLFPDARFIHISRDPYTLLPSTARMYRAFESTQAFQVPPSEGLEEYVLRTGQRVYRSYLKHCGTLAENRHCEVRFEDLTRDGIGTMEQIYDRLELGDFEPARAAVEAYTASRKSYKKNSYSFPTKWKDEIEHYWHDYFEHFGYERVGTTSPDGVCAPTA